MTTRKPLQFQVCSSETVASEIGSCEDKTAPTTNWMRARAAILKLPHGTVRTPVFMPVGTKVILMNCNLFLKAISSSFHIKKYSIILCG